MPLIDNFGVLFRQLPYVIHSQNAHLTGFSPKRFYYTNFGKNSQSFSGGYVKTKKGGVLFPAFLHIRAYKLFNISVSIFDRFQPFDHVRIVYRVQLQIIPFRDAAFATLFSVLCLRPFFRFRSTHSVTPYQIKSSLPLNAIFKALCVPFNSSSFPT